MGEESKSWETKVEEVYQQAPETTVEQVIVLAPTAEQIPSEVQRVEGREEALVEAASEEKATPKPVEEVSGSVEGHPTWGFAETLKAKVESKLKASKEAQRTFATRLDLPTLYGYVASLEQRVEALEHLVEALRRLVR